MDLKDRLRILHEMSGLSLRGLNEKLGLSGGHYNKFLAGEFNPKLDTMEKLRHLFPQIEPLWIYTGEGPMNKSTRQEIMAVDPAFEYWKNANPNAPDHAPDHAPDSAKNHSISQILTTESGALIKPNLYILDARAAAGPSVMLSSIQRMNELPAAYLPQLSTNQEHICLQITGDSMAPTIYDHDWLVCYRVLNLTQIREGYVYVLVTESGVVAKRLSFKDRDHKKVVLRSDNRSYSTYEERTEDIQQIWRVVMKFSTTLRNESISLYNDLQDLSKDVDVLRRRLDGLEGRLKGN